MLYPGSFREKPRETAGLLLDRTVSTRFLFIYLGATVFWHKVSPLHCWIPFSLNPERAKPPLVSFRGRNSRDGVSMRIHEGLNLIVTLTKIRFQDSGPDELQYGSVKRSVFHLPFADKKMRGEKSNHRRRSGLGRRGKPLFGSSHPLAAPGRRIASPFPGAHRRACPCPCPRPSHGDGHVMWG